MKRLLLGLAVLLVGCAAASRSQPPTVEITYIANEANFSWGQAGFDRRIAS